MSSTSSLKEAGAVEDRGRVSGRISIKRAAMAGAGLYDANWWTTGRFIESTDDAYVGGNVTAISSHVPGYIAAVLVEDNQAVRAGQVLTRLDQRDYRTTEDRARAIVDDGRAALVSLHAQVAEQQLVIAQCRHRQ